VDNTDRLLDQIGTAPAEVGMTRDELCQELLEILDEVEGRYRFPRGRYPEPQERELRRIEALRKVYEILKREQEDPSCPT
jgi:hypothetical protein